jgi:hypothetical protein
MLPLTEKQVRSCFANSSLRERNTLTLPDGFDELNWADLDYLGWRDRKLPGVGYAIVELDGAPVGVILRRADKSSRTRAQCNWCHDVELPNEVVFFSAKRAGAAGRNGNTVGTLVCSEFECSANVRKRPSMAYIGFDVEAERQRRIAALGENVRGFVRVVLDGE